MIAAARALKAAAASKTPLAARQVANWQRTLETDPDGLIGKTTRQTVDAVLAQAGEDGPAWPGKVDALGVLLPRPTGTAEPIDVKLAALDLRNYVQVFKGDRVPRIKAYQTILGLKPADGIVGRNTKARVAEVLGEPWESKANV